MSEMIIVTCTIKMWIRVASNDYSIVFTFITDDNHYYAHFYLHYSLLLIELYLYYIPAWNSCMECKQTDREIKVIMIIIIVMALTRMR